ncbi:MAG: dienelactone hydrolase family protein [Myxococcales bacterium]|nr:dienelactone hydrolase family protein [Myxococcales bacterium]
MNSISIKTEDGDCPAYVFEGGKPAVLFYMDGIGIRPALFEIGERLAQAGYRVLLPDLFYRSGPYQPMNAKTVFSDPAQRAELFSRFMSKTTVPNVMRDTRAFLDWLGAPKVGITGYCMGGRFALAAAGTYPDRIAAAAAYHPGNPASDAPESPHLLAPRMKARVYVGGASEDASFPEEQKKRLEESLTAARVDHLIETYPARHGWVPSDTPAHDPACAERHWRTLLDLFERTLE